MRALITRTGGFTGVSRRHEVDLSDAELGQLRKCVERLQPVIPKSFSSELTVNGETFTVSGADAELLLEKLRRAE